MTSTKIRVLVVEDSLTVRRHLCDVLASDPEIEVVGEATDGKQAVVLCEKLSPDVITMDMVLPGMSGLAATEHIMANRPTPILVVSSSTNRGELMTTYEALAAGAVDVMAKPRGDDSDADWARSFLGTLKLVSRIRVITHPRARLGALGRSTSASVPAPRDVERAATACKVIGIGVSTGGPGAIVELLKAIPKNFSIPILLVMHIGEQFAAAFADWLRTHTALSVGWAQDGMSVDSQAGALAIARPESHLVVRDHVLRASPAAPRHSCRPSIDVLFESIALDYGPAGAGCLLTGMGVDGAAGLLAIRQRGGVTLAQDEASSVVYGMPREAARLGAAQRILPLAEIGPALARLAAERAEARR